MISFKQISIKSLKTTNRTIFSMGAGFWKDGDSMRSSFFVDVTIVGWVRYVFIWTGKTSLNKCTLPNLLW